MVHVYSRELREEAGYSLVEVMFAIILLTIALLPMVGMFDMGIKSATSSGNYDKARALANLKMEEAKSLPFSTLRDNFPVTGPLPRLPRLGPLSIRLDRAETGPTAPTLRNSSTWSRSSTWRSRLRPG